MSIFSKRNKTTHLTLTLNNMDVTETKEHKHLCITFYFDGSWNQHVNNISSKASLRLNILNMLRKFQFYLSIKEVQISS